jgi:peptidoglycan/xylan/chitin deacetylase (PgdA/CDA1 family)
MRNYILTFITILLGLLFLASSFQTKNSKSTSKPKISFSFDDGSTRDFPNYPNKEWNKQLLNTLAKNDIKAILFVKGKGLDNSKGKNILDSWNKAGHQIGNHTYHHPNFNNDKTTLKEFKNELLKNDSLIKDYSNYVKLFRFPYLSEGNTVSKRDEFRSFLNENNYKNGHVTIDASDWYVDSRLTKRLKTNPDADISSFKDFYIKHLFTRAQFYDSLGIELTGRHISHNLLLHHNLSASLFLDDLIKYFKKNGWEVLNTNEAYKDDIYNEIPSTLPAGGSLIWALAKQTSNYDSILRYPAEDSRYEKVEMDSLGL